MATTKRDIQRWLDQGLQDGATHVIVVVDTYDYEDYPVYVSATQNVHTVLKAYQGVNMQRVMEVYDLRKPIQPQLNERRAFNL